MKTPATRFCQWMLIGLILVFLFTVLEIHISTLIAQNNFEIYRTCCSIMFTITIGTYIVILVVKTVQYQKHFLEYESKILEESKKKLGPEFKTVLLKNSGSISTELFQCHAKVENDGRITCKLYLDLETQIDNFEEFFKLFHFSED